MCVCMPFNVCRHLNLCLLLLCRLLADGTVERRNFVSSPSIPPPDFYFDGVWPAVAEYLGSGTGLIALDIDSDINFADGLHVGE